MMAPVHCQKRKSEKVVQVGNENKEDERTHWQNNILSDKEDKRRKALALRLQYNRKKPSTTFAQW
jgi:hypothetical protein